MKILFIHNYYRTSSPSGEDIVAINERNLLMDNGVITISYEKFNDNIDTSDFFRMIRMGLNYAWSKRTYNEVVALIKQERPDLAHAHSIHPQISPSVYAACQDMGVPVVHTLHNYRYICPGALLQRCCKPCEDCVGRIPFNALRHRCYRGSLAATSAVFWMVTYNRLRGTFTNRVNRYIALTEFAASRLKLGGLPANRIEVKPNYLAVLPPVITERKRFAVYVGRLSVEKGVRTLLSAWSAISDLPLKVLGDGPLRAELEMEARMLALDIHFLGSRSTEEVLEIVGSSLLQVVPSEWYEGFPMVILEAYACATPVIASRIGSLEEIVRDGETGLHFEAGNPVDLACKVNRLKANPNLAYRLGIQARKIFLENYTPQRNIKQLVGIYQRAQEDFQQGRERA